jgi:hypothetical protein
MLAAIASAALIVAGSLAVGQAVLSLCGRRDATWVAGPVGLAVILAVAGIVAHAGGRGTAVAIVFVCLIVAGAVWLGSTGFRHALNVPALVAAGLAALFAALPFIAAGNVGILGVGLVNDDMASHLLIADWIDERFRPEPVFIDQGYPLGPHALVAGLSSLFGASSIDVFAGLLLAIPALTALVGYSALGALRPSLRAAAAVVVALPYLAAAYLAQEAFKEPILALFLLVFVLLMPSVKRPLDAVPLGIVAAGTVYVYSFPGLAWLGGAAVAWLVIEWIRERRSPVSWAAVGAGVLVVVVALAPELPRLLDFIDFRALHPDRANEGGLGNLGNHLSPLTAFGIWPTSEFRLDAGAGSLPAAAYYLGAAVGVAALALALPEWIRRHGTAIPAALLTAVALYVFARAWGTVYTSAKALAIIAPLITLVTLGGLLGAPRRWAVLLATAVAIGTAFSSFLILRQAPVEPEGHTQELAKIRPLVEGEKVLFLGRDNFILYELRGSRPFVATRNFYVPDSLYVQPNTELDDVFSKFDFDSVTARTLAEFPYVLTTRAAYASGPPPGYRVAEVTDNYVLWVRHGDALDRLPGEAGTDPGAVLACGGQPPREAAIMRSEPIVVPFGEWSAATIEDGEESVARVDVPAGMWSVSLQYDSTRPVTIDAGENSPEPAVLDGNLDFRGPAPFYPAGSLGAVTDGEVTITASVQRPPLAGRLLGANSVAHLGALALTPRVPPYVRGVAAPFPGSSEVKVQGTEACGRYVDWFVPR